MIDGLRYSLNRVQVFKMPRKKLKRPSVYGVESQVASLTDVTTVDNLSEYDLEHVFSFLSCRDKATAAQVCRHWKSIIYQKSLWRNNNKVKYVSDTADMQIMAPSLVQRGITDVFFADAYYIKPNVANKSKANSCSVLFRNQQFCHLTRIMAESITGLNLLVIRPVNYRVVQKFLSVSMPNLISLILWLNFQLRTETVKSITHNCSNLTRLSLYNCKNITKEGFLHLGMNLSKLKSLTLEGSEHLRDPVLHNMTVHLPELEELKLIYTRRKITDRGVAHVANLKNLRVLDLTLSRHLTVNCIDKLSSAGSAVRELRVNVCADEAMRRIGRSHLFITHLLVGCLITRNCCQATEAGIDGLLDYGHKHYRSLGIEGKSDISVNGMIKMGTQLNDLVSLKINRVEKIGDVRNAVKEREQGNS